MSGTGIAVYHTENSEYYFEFPSEPDYFSASLYDAMELIGLLQYQEAEPILRRIIETCPDHIDAIFHLALVMKYTGRSIELRALIEQAVNIGKKYLPTNFKPGKDTLPWGILENRGYLRACHGLGLEYLEKKEYKEALSIFNELLALNPNDNQDIRELAILCCFELTLPKKVVSICNNFQDVTDPCINWGRVLALYQTGKIEEAAAATIIAKESARKAGLQLLKKKNTKPKDDDEAYYFRKDFGKYWKETEGALTFLKEHMRD